MKNLKSYLLVLLTVVTLTSSKPSHSAIGAALSAPVAVTTGLIISGTAGAFTIYDFTFNSYRHMGKGLLGLVFGIPLTAIGLVILEEEQLLSFSPLSNTQATSLSISSEEAAIYNLEIDQANALFAHVAEEMSSAEDQSTEASVLMWNDLKESVSAETFSVMVKITEKLH